MEEGLHAWWRQPEWCRNVANKLLPTAVIIQELHLSLYIISTSTVADLQGVLNVI